MTDTTRPPRTEAGRRVFRSLDLPDATSAVVTVADVLAIEAEAAAPDAGLPSRDDLDLALQTTRWWERGRLGANGLSSGQLAEEVLAALAAHPAVHMKQSGNGCVTCSRKWSQHTDAEKRAPGRMERPGRLPGAGR